MKKCLVLLTVVIMFVVTEWSVTITNFSSGCNTLFIMVYLETQIQ